MFYSGYQAYHCCHQGTNSFPAALGQRLVATTPNPASIPARDSHPRGLAVREAASLGKGWPMCNILGLSRCLIRRH